MSSQALCNFCRNQNPVHCVGLICACSLKIVWKTDAGKTSSFWGFVRELPYRHSSCQSLYFSANSIQNRRRKLNIWNFAWNFCLSLDLPPASAVVLAECIPFFRGSFLVSKAALSECLAWIREHFGGHVLRRQKWQLRYCRWQGP